MPGKLKLLYWTIEINLILWIIMCSSVFLPSARDIVKPVAIGGFVLSALLQHWAYYHVRKAGRGEV